MELEEIQDILTKLKEKFTSKTLTVEDFDIEIKKHSSEKSNVPSDDSNDVINDEQNDVTNFNFNEESIESDYELEIENGQVTVTSPVKKGGGICYECQIAGRRTTEKKKSVKEEQVLRNRMKLLMSTFEIETKKLDNKLQSATNSLKNNYEEKFSLQLEEEKEHWTGIINDLLGQLEYIKTDRENLVVTYEQEKKDIEQFYLARIKEDRKKMKLEMQKNILKSNQEWQKTKI